MWCEADSDLSPAIQPVSGNTRDTWHPGLWPWRKPCFVSW